MGQMLERRVKMTDMLSATASESDTGLHCIREGEGVEGLNLELGCREGGVK